MNLEYSNKLIKVTSNKKIFVLNIYVLKQKELYFYQLGQHDEGDYKHLSLNSQLWSITSPHKYIVFFINVLLGHS